VDFGAPLTQGPGGAPLSPAPPAERLLVGWATGRADAVRDALGFLGTPYVWAAPPGERLRLQRPRPVTRSPPRVSVPHFAASQAALGAPVARDALASGDVVYFADPTGTSTTSASTSATGGSSTRRTRRLVKLSQLSSPYYAAQYAGARRY